VFERKFGKDLNQIPLIAFFARMESMSYKSLLSILLLVFLSSLGRLSAQDQPSSDANPKLQLWPQLYITDIDGKNLKRLFPQATSRAEGSPSFSENGELIIFSGFNAEEKGRISTSDIYLYNLTTEEEKVLCKGVNPSLSPRGKRFFYSRYDVRGVWVASVENPEDTTTKLDAKGWGTAWSPNGKMLAWATYSNGYNLKILDIIEGDEWQVFQGEKSPFRLIYPDFSWSPDSRNIVFKGVTQERTTGIYAVEVIDEREPVLLQETSTVNKSFDWHPDGSKILFSELDPESKIYRLYTMEPLKPNAKPVPIPNIPPEIIATNPRYTPNGKQIIFSAAIKPVPVPKPVEQKEEKKAE